MPADGLLAWDAPDGLRPPGVTLDPGLDVQVLDQQGEWAHIVCSNGWQAWVEAGRLVPMSSSKEWLQPAPGGSLTFAPPAATPRWVPSHVAPGSGMPTWLAASPAAPVGERLDPGLPVEVLERQESWARIACSNGWQAWVDGRLLEPYGGSSETTPPAASDTSPGALPGEGRVRGPAAAFRILFIPRRPSAGEGPLSTVGLLALPGAALVIAGSLLPLVSVAGFSVSAWQVPAQFLFTDSPDPSSLSLGVLMMVVVLVALPVVLRHPLPPIALMVIASPATNTGVHIVLRKLASPDYPDIGVGALMILVGGFLITAEALRATWLARKDAFR
ncbi:MAG TPA: SH3 domain-containing protein [Candidatus Deferrimicrobium sp.]|nr:SH3 domain-containing protein [Candidatus Deferrimicrobium sp.]